MLVSLGRSHRRTVRSSEQLMRPVRSDGFHSVVQTGCLCSFHVFRIALLFTSNACIEPLSPPATKMRPSLLRFPERAMSSTPNREMVLTTFRVLEEKICTRDPVVTANRSCGAVSEFEGGGGGIEICVTGDECCDGSRRSSEVNEFQYCCSEVMVEGPLGSFTGCSSCTSAAMAGYYAQSVCDWRVCSFALRRPRTNFNFFEMR